MVYLTVKEAGQKWGLGTRIVTLYCAQGRIDGAAKRGNLWLIPESAARPADKRRRAEAEERISPERALSIELSRVMAATFAPMPFFDPDAVVRNAREERFARLYDGDLSYLRGDFKRVMRCYQKTAGDEAARLRACPAAIAAAISLGDYRAYTEIGSFLKRYGKASTMPGVSAAAELSLATAAVSVVAPAMAPEWLREGDLSALSPHWRQNALYLRSKYLHCVGSYEAMLAVAQTALTLCACEDGFTPHDIYLRVMCAAACHELGRDLDAERWLLEAMRLGLPHGFITPFAEVVTAFGGLMERCLEREFPQYLGVVLAQWKRTWKNWIEFHNQFTKDHITLMLSLREYHLAQLVARRVPYAKIAKQYGISVGRLKNIMLEIYEKLCISSRGELARFIL